MAKNWDESENWYTSCVGKEGHYYHREIVLPNVLRLLGKFTSLLDLGCGQGVLARKLPKQVRYVGIDQSQELIKSAEKLTHHGTFLTQDATEPLASKENFDRVVFILSLQNMENGKEALQNGCRHLRKGGEILIVLNHPAYRIPRQSGWGVDENMKLQYRRVNLYMSEQTIPIQTNPSKKERSATTMTYHHPISTYFEWLSKDCLVSKVEEWCSNKKSQGSKAKMEDRARREFPLFLAIKAIKG